MRDEQQKPFHLSINRRLCKKCGLCIAFCPTEVYLPQQDGSPEIAHPEKCIECKMCVIRCPEFAIFWEGEK